MQPSSGKHWCVGLTPPLQPTCTLPQFRSLIPPPNFVNKSCFPFSQLNVPNCLLPISHTDENCPPQVFSSLSPHSPYAPFFPEPTTSAPQPYLSFHWGVAMSQWKSTGKLETAPQSLKNPPYLCCPHSPMELSLLLLHQHLHLTLSLQHLPGGRVRSRGRKQTGRAHWDGLVFSEDYITSQLPGSLPSQSGTLLLCPSLPHLRWSLPSVSYLAFSLLSLQHTKLRANNKAFSAGCGQKGTEWNSYFSWHFFVSTAIRDKIE